MTQNDLKISKPNANSILVCYAVGTEASVFQVLRKIPSATSYHRLVTGMGSDNAERSVRNALDRLGKKLGSVDELWSCGFAGGLNPKWKIGAGLYAINDHFPKFRRSQIVSQLEKSGIRAGSFAMSFKALDTPDEKSLFFQQTGADAVEMESRIIGKICEERSIPMLTLRAISDTAHQAFPIPFGRLMDKNNNRIRMAALIEYILKRPLVILDLIRFRRQLETPLNTLRIATAALSELDGS